MGRLVIDGEHIYELDEECLEQKRAEKEKHKSPDKEKTAGESSGRK